MSKRDWIKKKLKDTDRSVWDALLKRTDLEMYKNYRIWFNYPKLFLQDRATGLIEKSNGIQVDISKIPPNASPDTLFSDGLYLQEVIKDLCQQKRKTLHLYALCNLLHSLSNEEWNQIFQTLYPKVASKTILCRNYNPSLLELKDRQTQIQLDFYILPNPSRPDFIAVESEDLASLTQNIIQSLLKRAEQKGRKRFGEVLRFNKNLVHLALEVFGSSPEFFYPEKSLLKKGRILLADHHVAFAQITYVELINLCLEALFKSELIDNYKFIPIWSDSDLSELIQNSQIRPVLIKKMVQVRDSMLNRWREQETFHIQVPENWDHLTFSDPTVAYLRPGLKKPFSILKDVYVQMIAEELKKPVEKRFEIPYDPLDESSITFTAHASRYDQIRLRSNLHYIWFRLFSKRLKFIECMVRWDHKKDQSDLYIDGYFLGPLERKSKPKAYKKLVKSE